MDSFTKFENIGKIIYRLFDNILQTFWGSEESAPTFDLQVLFTDDEKAIYAQYSINSQGVISQKNDFFSEHFMICSTTNYYGTFGSSGNAYYYYNCNGVKVYIAFVFQTSFAIEILKALTKIYISDILKGLSKLIGYEDISLYQEDLRRYSLSFYNCR